MTEEHESEFPTVYHKRNRRKQKYVCNKDMYTNTNRLMGKGNELGSKD